MVLLRRSAVFSRDWLRRKRYVLRFHRLPGAAAQESLPAASSAALADQSVRGQSCRSGTRPTLLLRKSILRSTGPDRSGGRPWQLGRVGQGLLRQLSHAAKLVHRYALQSKQRVVGRERISDAQYNLPREQWFLQLVQQQRRARHAMDRRHRGRGRLLDKR